MKKLIFFKLSFLIACCVGASRVAADVCPPVSSTTPIDEKSTITALRLVNTITGGLMPTCDPNFPLMVSAIARGDTQSAAWLAANTKYFTNYLVRRLALQMQSPALDSTIVTDSDGSAFVIAHLAGGPTTGGPTWQPSISTLWSENQTYLVNVTTTTGTTPTHINQIGDASALDAIDWSTQVVMGGKQMASTYSSVRKSMGLKTPLVPYEITDYDSGGYTTSSGGKPFDSSFAQYGLDAGTNLRMIEGIWEISTGLTLADVEDTGYAPPGDDALLAATVPNFVPENPDKNPNFYQGQGQTACIACHGGGMSNLTHGYSTVADVFDYTGGNLTYNDESTNPAARKSLGSTFGNGQNVLNCDVVKYPYLACNPLSLGPMADQGWDLSSWQAGTPFSTLDAMKWGSAPIKGNGLQSLGKAIGQAGIVYEYMTKRVVKEICPTGMFSARDISDIALAANPFATPKGTDNIRTIVAMVAANPSCQ